MDQKLDFIYDCLCDPFTSLDIIDKDTIEEIVSIATDK